MSMNKAGKPGKIRFGISKKLLLTVILLTILMMMSLASGARQICTSSACTMHMALVQLAPLYGSVSI